jgi:hypothetical protein
MEKDTFTTSCNFTLRDKYGNPIYTVQDETLFGITTESIKPKTLTNFRFDKSIQKIINETSGSFKGQNELIEHIIDIIKTIRFQPTDIFTKKCAQININDVKNFLPWLDTLTITIFWYFRDDGQHCDGESTNITSIKKPVNGNIKLFWYGNHLSNIAECLAHELLHLYEGYNRCLNKVPNLSNINKNYNKTEWFKFINSNDISDDVKMFLINIYNCFDNEINANASTIYTFLKNNNATSLDEIKDWLTKSDAYRKYASILYTNCPFYANCSTSIKQQYYNCYKQVFPNSTYTIDQVIELMTKKAKYALKKIAKNASLYLNYIQNSKYSKLN